MSLFGFKKNIKHFKENCPVEARNYFNEILSKRVFWILTIIFTLQLSANLGVYTHIPIYSQDLGFSPIQASWIFSVAAFNAALGKIIFGNL